MDDNQIIALFFQRNEDAIRHTDSVYGSRLFRISQNILRCQEDAQECVSDTYLRAWNAIPPTRPNSLFAFLARVCRNLSLTKLDWAMASKRKAEIVALTQEMEQCIPDSRRDNSMEAKELGRLLNAFLETQSRENQMVFVRRYWFGDSPKEIAARYGIKEGALIARLHRLRKKLAAYLEKEGISV